MQEFKVVCIGDDQWEYDNKWERIKEKLFGKKYPEPINNGIYTVIDEQDYVYYHLLEFPNEVFRKEHFIPLDEVKSSKYKTEEVEFLN